jgi:hypothetical protein
MTRILPIVVQFGGGAVLCLIGLWSGYRSGYLNLRYREDRRLVWTVVAGFVLLLLFSLFFTVIAPHLPADAVGHAG